MTGIAVVFTDGTDRIEVEYRTDHWRASMEWARFHGLDPMRVPAGSVIEWDPETRRLSWDEYEYDSDGRIQLAGGHLAELEPVTVRRVEQAEAPPLPFPRRAA